MRSRYEFTGLTASASWIPGVVADGAQASTTISVPGAALGDYVDVSYSLDNELLLLRGYVDSADSVTVIANNNSGAGVIFNAGTVYVKVTKR